MCQLDMKATLNEEVCDLNRRLLDEVKQRKSIEHELAKLKRSELESDNNFEVKYPMHFMLYFIVIFIL